MIYFAIIEAVYIFKSTIFFAAVHINI